MNEDKIIYEYLTQIKQNKSANTLRAYHYSCQDLLNYLNFSGKNIFFLSSQNEVDKFTEYLSDIGLSERTIKHRVTVLRNILKFSIMKGYIPDSKPHISCSAKEKIEYVQEDDIEILFKYCSYYDEYDDYYSLRAKVEILLVLLFGFKIIDLKSLKVDNLSIEKKELSSNTIIRYIYDERLIPIIIYYLQERSYFIADLNQESDYLFVNRYGRNITDNGIGDDLRKICSYTGVTISFGGLRNSCIKYYYSKMPDEVIISKIFDISKGRVKKLKSNDNKI